MKTISWECPSCHQHSCVEAKIGPLVCAHCSQPSGNIENVDSFPQTCPLCPGKQFYLDKDFNQALGCVIMLIGIVFVPMTYGLSLPAMALIDWLLYRRIPFMAICYRCGAEFRGFSFPEHFKPFLHHIGSKYDRYRK